MLELYKWNQIKYKVGILGGTFNPIHNGHIALAKSAKLEFDLDYVLLIPTGISYYKSEFLDGRTRLEMVLLASECEEYLKVSDMEVKREGNTYTIDTICALQELYPTVEFYLIIGEDTLFHIETWKKASEVLQRIPLLVAHRPSNDDRNLEEQMEHLRNLYHSQIALLEMKEVPISSSHIRKCIQSNQSVSHILDDKVWHYIQFHQLYQSTS
ncbi:MAG: nicotinate-nucleotide adenylyltransferase [Eubacteriales bacterium]